MHIGAIFDSPIFVAKRAKKWWNICKKDKGMTEGYIDIHSHILPGVDDGAKSMEMSMQMIDMAYAQGIRTMIATPHFTPSRKRVSVERLKEIYQKRKEAIKER